MTGPDSIPTLYRLLFGDSAPAAVSLRSPRLMRWASAFDEWLAERRHTGGNKLHNASLKSWRSLLELLQKPPWEITALDIARYRDCLIEQGRAANTIKQDLSIIAAFYKWCGRVSIDPQACHEQSLGVFNPVAGVARPSPINYATAKILTPEETGALLDVLKADESLLSRRDYAFFLSRLRLGVPDKMLRQLKWGQVELKAGRAWVAWAPGKPLSPMPDEVWEAILGYLEAAGRVGPKRPEGMHPDAYIFAPLVSCFGRHATGLAQEWTEQRSMLGVTLLGTLKIYGARVGIEEPRLTLHTLRYTALARYLETSPSTADLQAFLGHPARKMAVHYRRWIRRIRDRQPPSDFEALLPSAIRSRQPRDFTSEENFKHGLYAPHLLPPEQVQAIMDEEIVGMKEETDGFEFLLDRLVERLEEPGLSERAVLELGEAHLMSTARIKELFDFENDELGSLSPEDAQAVKLYQEFCKEYALPGGSEPTLENIRYWVDDDEPDGAVKDERLSRRIAADRLVLRNIKAVALETSDPIAYAGLVQKYGRHCLRLCKLLKKARPASGRIKAWVDKELQGYIDGLWEWVKQLTPIMIPGWTGPIPRSGPPPP